MKKPVKRTRGRPELPDTLKKQTLVIRLEPNEHDAVAVIAESEGVSKSSVIRRFVMQGLKKAIEATENHLK